LYKVKRQAVSAESAVSFPTQNAKHSPSWEADSRLAGQGTPSMGLGRSLQCAQKPDAKSYCVTAASGLQPHFSILEIHFNIILPPTPKCPTLSLLFMSILDGRAM
jgi:hypothetical protein